MSIAALMRLNDALMNMVYRTLYDYAANDDDAMTPAQKIEILTPAFQQYQDSALRVMTAILSTEPPEPSEEDSAAGKSVSAYLAALPFSVYLRTMGTVAKEFSRRVSWVHEQRAVKQGRMFSQANLDILQGVHDGMRTHLDSLSEVLSAHVPAKSLTAPAPDANAVADALAAYIRFQTTRAVLNGVPTS